MGTAPLELPRTSISTCQMTEPDGTPLAEGVLHHRYREPAQEWVTVRLERPGQIIQRCLVGNLRVVLLRIDSDPERRAEVDRLVFDPSIGRVCVLRLPVAEPPAS
jgi:hypothetical protein